MKLLKNLLIVIIVIIAIPLIAALFVKKDYKVTRDVIIERPKEMVFDYVKYLKNQNNYGKWANIDSNMKQTFEGTDGTVGFVSMWESDNNEVGTGEQEITKIDEGKRIEYEFRFKKPIESTSPGFMSTEEIADNQTKVTWGFNGHMKYPMNLMMLFMDFESLIGNDLQVGLDKLKEILESQPIEAKVGTKAFLLQYFNQTTDSLIADVSTLTEAQLTFKPAPDSWSVSQCLEHIVASEKMLFDMAKKEMEKPAQPELKDQVKTSDTALISMMTDRSKKFQAPKELQGTGEYKDPQVAINDFLAARKPVLEYIENTDVENMRNHISDYPTGKSDGYQNLLFIAAHCARHTKQIEEIMANPNFPKG
ncbi:DinB family protein [Galbibacter sp. PAP.153]|uniref:DinB family protein n=1 Tax=Galbibacter sp. PAP.153 TaxID=3104623 RepID=UPI00300A8745